jgi:hypothetical protein
MSTKNPGECCPEFDPGPWEDKEIVWNGRLFVQDSVCSIMYIPLNFGSVMKRNMAAIEAAGGKDKEVIVLSADRSAWRSDVYISVSKEIAGAKMATLSGTFLTKVFEGPYRNMRGWIEETKSYVRSKSKTVRKLYFYYTTCPKCAAKYGRNYVVILAEVQ